MAAGTLPQEVNTLRDERASRRSTKLPWAAVFCLGLLVGWFVLGRILLPASPSDAEPPQLTASYQKIYLRLVAESYWLTQNNDLMQRALAGWDRDALDLRLSQMETDITDPVVLTHLEALRTALDTPAGPYTFFDFVFTHSTILISSALPLLMFLGAGGIGIAPYVRDLFVSGRAGRDDEDLLMIPGATQQAPATAMMQTAPGDIPATEGLVTKNSSGAAVAQPSVDPLTHESIGEQPAPTNVTILQPQETPQAPGVTRKSPAEVLLPEEADESATQGQTPNEGQIPQSDQANPAGPNAHTTEDVHTGDQDEQDAERPPAQPGEPQQAQSPVSAVAAALNDSILPGELESLLADDIFGSIFDVDVLFDPFLKELSSKLDDVDIDDLLCQTRLVALGLYGTSRLPDPDSNEETSEGTISTGLRKQDRVSAIG